MRKLMVLDEILLIKEYLQEKKKDKEIAKFSWELQN